MANTSYQSKSKNKPTGQLPAQVRAKMEEERQKLLDKAKAERTRKQGVKRLQGTAAERATASEFGAAMSSTMSKDDKARASKRSNPKDLRYTGTDAKNKVQAGEAARKNRSRAMEAAAAKRKITQAEAGSKVNRAKSQGGRSAADVAASKKAAPAKSYNLGVSKGGVSFKEAFKHFRSKGQSTFTWNGKKYTTEVAKAKPKAKVSTPTPADFTATGKKAAPKKPASKDPRKGFASKATPGKAKSGLPAGAKPFKGSYNSKTHKLQNINGKTYVVPKGK